MYFYFSTIENLKKFMGESNSIDSIKFQEFCKLHRALLYPAFHVQQQIREEIMGEHFWKKQEKVREKYPNRKFGVKSKKTINKVNDFYSI